MTAFLNHFAFEFKTGLRNPTSLLLNYLFPLGFYILMGVVMTQINPLFRETLVPAMVIFVVMVGPILGLPTPLVESREAGIYRSFKINGVPATSILIVPTLTTVFHSLIVAAIIVVTAPLFKGTMPTNWGAFVWVTLLMACVYSGLGALIGVVSSSGRATVLWSQLIFLPSMLIGGMMVPLDMLPESVQPFAGLLPTSHAMQALLGLAYQQETVFKPFVSVAVLASSGLLAYGLAIYLFNWDNRNQARRGHPLMGLLVMIPYLVGMFLA